MTAAEDIGSFDALVDDEDRGIKILVCHPFLLQHLNGARSYGWLNVSGERWRGLGRPLKAFRARVRSSPEEARPPPP